MNTHGQDKTYVFYAQGCYRFQSGQHKSLERRGKTVNASGYHAIFFLKLIAGITYSWYPLRFMVEHVPVSHFLCSTAPPLEVLLTIVPPSVLMLAALMSLLTSGLWHLGQRTFSISDWLIRSNSKVYLQLSHWNSCIGISSTSVLFYI